MRSRLCTAPSVLPRMAVLVVLCSLVPAGRARAQAPGAEPPARPAAEAPVPVPREAVCLFLPSSGPHAALGARVARAVEAAFGAGAGIPLRRADTRGSAEEAAALVRRAGEDGCLVVLGGLGDREAVAMADAAEAVGMPFLSLGASPDGNTRRAVAWVRTPRSGPPAELARRLVAAGVKRASGAGDGTSYARAAGAAFRAAFEAAGGKITAWQPLAGDGREAAKVLGEAVRAAREAEPCAEEAVFVAAGVARSRRLVAFLGFEGVLGKGDGKCAPPVLVGTPLWNDPAGLARSGDSLQGARFADVGPAVAPGDAGSVLEVEAADAGALALALLKNRAGRGREGILEGLQGGIRWTGASGELSLAAGSVSGRPVAVFFVDRGAVTAAQAPGRAPAGE